MDKPVVATLLQRVGPGRSQELILHEDEVRLTYRSAVTESHRTVPLEVIDPNETTARAFPGWLGNTSFASALVALLAAIWAIRLGPTLWPASTAWVAWAAGVAAAIAFVAGALFRLLASDTHYFYNGFNGDFLFALLQTRPDRQVVADFIAKMKELAKKRYEQLKSDALGPSPAKELQALHELLEKKIITPAEFEQKKSEVIEEVLRE